MRASLSIELHLSIIVISEYPNAHNEPKFIKSSFFLKILIVSSSILLRIAKLLSPLNENKNVFPNPYLNSDF